MFSILNLLNLLNICDEGYAVPCTPGPAVRRSSVRSRSNTTAEIIELQQAPLLQDFIDVYEILIFDNLIKRVGSKIMCMRLSFYSKKMLDLCLFLECQ